MKGVVSVVALLALAVLFAGCSGDKVSVAHTVTQAPAKPAVTAIHAVLAPPLTTFTSNVTGLPSMGNPLVTWSNTNSCGTFEKSPGLSRGFNGTAKAVWHHGDDTDCSHASAIHAGTITLTVVALVPSFVASGTDSETYTCTYTKGSGPGDGEPCAYSRVYYTEEEAAPAPAAIAVLATLAVAAALRRP